MYTLLIVDDDKIERDGIKLLVNRFDLKLDTFEAENGEKALEVLSSNPIDILITDIKMPLMDGLELSQIARILYPNLKIVIFSAYGEFEYARKAIDVKVHRYILKPIEVDEFLPIMHSLIRMCVAEQEKEQSEKLLRTMEIEKTLMDLINGVPITRLNLHCLEEAGLLQGHTFQMMIVDFNNRFFDTHDERFNEILQQLTVPPYTYLNLNEYQSLLFFRYPGLPYNREQLHAAGGMLQQKVMEDFGLRMTLVFGKPINEISAAKAEINSMEQMLEYKFFFEEGIILFTHEDVQKASGVSEQTKLVLDTVYRHILNREYSKLEQGIDLLFESLKSEGSFSAIFTMYTCSEILKKLYEQTRNISNETYVRYLEKIFKARVLTELRDTMNEAIAEIKVHGAPNPEELNKKVIKDILKLIDQNYMNDLSLEMIAQKVYLSPSYVSYLFKKETSLSLIKFITQYRLEKAKSLLMETNMKIADISEKVGYVNISYFCMAFKNNYGSSPAKYREKEKAE